MATPDEVRADAELLDPSPPDGFWAALDEVLG
jgi:hypothetical protein